MNTPTHVTEFREQQVLQEQSAHLGLSGLASGVSRHDFIEARMGHNAAYLLQLLEEGKQEEVHTLWNTKIWSTQE